MNLKRGIEGREVVVANNNANNTVAHPVDGRQMKPKFLGGDAPEVEGQDPRKALAAWLTAPDNAAFRQTMANIIWAHFFGRGIVEPVDDVRISNPPSNKELLEELGKQAGRVRVRQEEADPRHLQLADVPALGRDERDERAGRGVLLARLRPPLAGRGAARHDHRRSPAPKTASRSRRRARGPRRSTPAISNYFLTTFGRAARETACSCEVNREANLSQALHLVNGDTITQKIAQGKLHRRH